MKYIFIIFCFFNLSANAIVRPSGIETNGGDAIAAEAFRRIDILLLGLKNRAPIEVNQDIFLSLVALREKVQISSEERVHLDGVEKDAINLNLPIPQIVFSRTSWQRLNDRQKDHLVLHELLPLAGYPDRDYKLSSQLILKAGSSSMELRDLMRKLYFCDTNAWVGMSRPDLELFRSFDMFALVKNSYCITGLEVLVKAGWDINDCSKNDTTMLTRLESESTDNHGRELEQFLNFKKRVLELGGERVCSPTHKSF